jgi:hypothetical protein
MAQRIKQGLFRGKTSTPNHAVIYDSVSRLERQHRAQLQEKKKARRRVKTTQAKAQDDAINNLQDANARNLRKFQPCPGGLCCELTILAGESYRTQDALDNFAGGQDINAAAEWVDEDMDWMDDPGNVSEHAQDEPEGDDGDGSDIEEAMEQFPFVRAYVWTITIMIYSLALVQNPPSANVVPAPHTRIR